jgi:hypothetical protein
MVNGCCVYSLSEECAISRSNVGWRHQSATVVPITWFVLWRNGLQRCQNHGSLTSSDLMVYETRLVTMWHGAISTKAVAQKYVTVPD